MIAAVTVSPISNEVLASSVEEIIDTCFGLVVFDTRLDSFRFVHPSAQEYLEKKFGPSTAQVAN
jgi:hypothetical protein